MVRMSTQACLSRPNTFHSRYTKPPSSRNCGHQESVLFGSETCVERSHSIFGTNRHKNRRTTDRNTTSADGMYLYIELVCTATTHIQQSNMDQPRKVAKPARGQLHKDVKYPCTVRRCIRGKYLHSRYTKPPSSRNCGHPGVCAVWF